MHDRSSEGFRIFHQPPAPGSPEEKLERTAREVFGEMRGRNGRAIDYDVRRGKTNPLRTLSTKLERAKRSGVPRSQILKLKQALDEYIDRRWPECSDEFRRRA